MKVWHYVQRTGGLYSDEGELIATGYSGHGTYKNVPAAEGMRGEGPIPRGTYTVGGPIDTSSHGKYVLPLIPDKANRMYGRSGFLVHGDSVLKPGTASIGCIIQSRVTRGKLHDSGALLKVVAEVADIQKESVTS